MKHVKQLVLFGAVLGLAACTGSVSGAGDCPQGEEYDEERGRCVSTFGGQDTGSVSDGTGGDGMSTDDDASDDDEGMEPTGKDKPPEPDCDKWEDSDDDGKLCNYDNCPNAANSDQKDQDFDGIGDACDNCPKTANVAQRDSNDDDKGDACTGDAGYSYDADHDGDGQPTTRDNCPKTSNSNQTDSDVDGWGDTCDNCPKAANYDQTDSDSDGTGDACSTQPSGMECDRVKETSQIQPTDLYVILDKSGSMRGQPMQQAKDALDKFAQVIGGTSMQFGLYAFDTVSCREFLPMGTHSTSQIQNSYAGITPQGSTPTGPAMENVRTQGLYQPSGSGSGDNAVIVITDGRANRCSCNGATCSTANQYAIDEAGKFYNQANTKVYVVGFNFTGDTSVLNQMAQAGGTGSYYEANNPNKLTQTLLGVALAGCSIDLNSSSKGKIDPEKLWVKVNNTWVKSENITYNKSEHSVKIDPSVCSTQSGQRTVTVVAGCPTECDDKSEEVCDYEDNDCDGEIDEGCQGCVPELCDGEDNDCDGDIDEGCCDGATRGESCTQDSDCCRGHCRQDGVCGPPCRPDGVTCEKDSQCCGTSVCGTSGDTSVCVGG